MKSLALAALCTALAAPVAWAEPITPIAEARRGTMVTVSGTVTRITDEDEFRLGDASGTIRVYVGPDRVPVDIGEAVVVQGVVDDGLGPREVYARSLRRADGRVISFRRHD